MRGVAVVMVAVLGLGGCAGVRYQGTEENMQKIVRGIADLMGKSPEESTMAAVGSGAHAAMSKLMGQEPEAECTPMLVSGGCLQEWQKAANQAPTYSVPKKDWSGLPPDFWKTTSIGKD